jgi:Meckel syndrome type 1 protein
VEETAAQDDTAVEAAPEIAPSLDLAPSFERAPSQATGPQQLELRVHQPALLDRLRAFEGWIIAGLLLLVAILAGFWFLERRRNRIVPRLAAMSQPTGAFTADTEAASADSAAATPASAPPRIDLALTVTAASRSVMTLTLDIRLTLSNRSEAAVRGLLVSAKLDCVRPGETEARAAGAGQPLGEIARIGPHQGTTLTGQVRLPVSELSLIRQGTGSGRVYIPLVHVTFAGEGVPATERTFVIGTPSAAGAGRLHPLPVAAQVGGIHGLAAQLVRVPEAPAPAREPA